MRDFQTLRFQTTDIICSDTFQPKIFPSKMKKTREFQTLRFQTTDIICSDTFRRKIFGLKLKYEHIQSYYLTI
jgi:hypothetical protein